MINFEELLEALTKNVPPRIRERGRALELRKDGILDFEVDMEDPAIFATVRGSEGRFYETAFYFTRMPNRSWHIEPVCECAFFQQHDECCKHLYALALRAAQTHSFIESAAVAPHREPEWHHRFAAIEEAARHHRTGRVQSAIRPEGKGDLLFVMVLPDLFKQGVFTLRPTVRTRLTSDEPRLTSMRLKTAASKRWPEPLPRFLDRLVARQVQRHSHGFLDSNQLPILELEDAEDLLPDLLDAGLLHLVEHPDDHTSIPLGNGLEGVWSLRIKGTLAGENLRIDGEWVLGDQRRPYDAPRIILATGLMILDDKVCRFLPAHFPWAASLRLQGPLLIPQAQAGEFVERSLRVPEPPEISMPDGLAFEVLREPPSIRVSLRHDEAAEGLPVAGLLLGYADQWIHPLATGDYVASENSATYHFRDASAEKETLRAFDGLKLLRSHFRSHQHAVEWIVPIPELAERVADWEARGWEVGWNGKPLRRADDSFIEVKGSGVDWFDLHAGVRFGEETLAMPTLLKGLKNGGGFVPLADGGVGLLPAGLTERLEAFRRLGGEASEDGGLRFQGARALLLDHWLSEQPGVTFDAGATRLRDRLRKLGAPEPANPAEGFSGELRGYQKEGLGWLCYLRDLGIQGCLADDMGLGKTVQVLALLWERKRASAKASLVVAPKSLLDNWERECRRFTPGLEPAVLSGSDRPQRLEDLPEADLYITSYPLLLRDIEWLREREFDYVVLDESQAIKNAKTRTHKACRLLRADHRLTMTGTPVENRVEDLCSQLEFLNPGLMPRVAPEGEALAKFGEALRPFLLRRKKEDVASDLPEKVEETLYVDLPPAQRKLYDELRDHYRALLAASVKQKGLGSSKIMVLEALLRLRQAACHPALVREVKRDPGSAKFDCLEELIGDILPAGHKVLVFSQFTKLLDLFAKCLQQRDVVFERLDGRVKHREPRIRRFQEDPECGVFLISLKAGGVGLNLTAADYVILLDPWWNPAAEAQAIDRAHRIGQDKKVFAYRIVARDSIEEKILELQDRKRGLADAILTRDNSLLRALNPEDLDFLLG
ncbi:MAG: DEAD/DEAH box helicase [Opitutales bacterium]